MNTVREKRIINLNSENAIKNNGTFLSNVSFNFSNVYDTDEQVISLSGGLMSAEIPVSFYSLNYTNNVLNYCLEDHGILEYYTITITPGFYDYDTLFSEMSAKFLVNSHHFTMTLNETTGKMTFTHTGTKTFYSIVYNGSTCFSLLGFEDMDYLATGDILNAPFLLDLLGTRKLKIMCHEFAGNNKDSVNSSTNQLVATVPVNQPPYGLILYSNFSNEYGNLQINNISTINIQILSELGQFINFNNTNWSMTFVLYIDRQLKNKTYNYLDNYLEVLPKYTNPTIDENVPQQTEEISDLPQIPVDEQYSEEPNVEESSLDNIEKDEELKLLLQ